MFAADEIGGGVARGGVEPRVDGGMAGERCGFLRGAGEDVLGDFFGAVGVAGNATEGGGVNEREVAADELAESFFGPGGGVGAEKFGVAGHAAVLLQAVAGWQSGRGF